MLPLRRAVMFENPVTVVHCLSMCIRLARARSGTTGPGKVDKADDSAGELVQRRSIRGRYLKGELTELESDLSRSDRPPHIDSQKVVALIIGKKSVFVTDWSRALMTQEAGMSASRFGMIWRTHRLNPHQVVGFKLSRDPKFAEVMDGIIGL
jgi:hypothetical protein